MSIQGSNATLNDVYAERNQVVACFARACHDLGFRAWIDTDHEAAKDPEWGPMVFILLPTGQVSWHIRSDELPMFNFLHVGGPGWDGHSNGEKFARLMAFKDRK